MRLVYTTKQFIIEIVSFMMIMGVGLGIYTMVLHQTYDYGTAIITITACCVSMMLAEKMSTST